MYTNNNSCTMPNSSKLKKLNERNLNKIRLLIFCNGIFECYNCVILIQL